MQTIFRRTLVLLAALALFAPAATATWFAQGSHEPDNGFDSESFMFFDAPGAATNRIYFNVVTGMSAGLRGIMVSPNSALLQTHNEIPTSETHQALFGVWVDCNGDGYVGMAEGALREYPADLLLDTTVCPGVTGPTTAWTPGAHNYNGWVSELVPIAGIPFGISANTTDLRHYEDPAAMVFGDYNLPDTIVVGGGGSCPIAPQPRGTWQSTGGALNYVDCLTGSMEVVNSVWEGRRLLAQDVPGLYDLGIPDFGLTFGNPNDARGHDVYDHANPAGPDGSDDAFVYVADCSGDAEPTFHSGDFFNETPLGPMVPVEAQNESVVALDPRLGDLSEADLAGQTNVTNEELNGDCDTTNDAGHDFYGNGATFYFGEADVAPVVAANKRASNFNFQLQFWGRGGDSLGFLEILEAGTGDAPYGGPAGAPAPAGPMTNWNNGASTTKTPGTVRVNIAEGTAVIPPAYYMTFYAHVGANTTARGFVTPGGSGVYGATQCGDHTDGIHHGWNCDTSQWYLDANGNPSPEVTPRARPGQVYQFRDIDCYDGGVGNSGVGLGAPYYGPDACPQVSG